MGPATAPRAVIVAMNQVVAGRVREEELRCGVAARGTLLHERWRAGALVTFRDALAQPREVMPRA